MNSIMKIAIALTLVLCLCIAFIACGDNNEDGYVYVTDEDGETILDDDGNPVTAPDTDGDGQPDDVESSDEGSGTGIGNDGANDETGWGEIIRPTN